MQDVAKWVAFYIKARINAFKPTAERPFVLGLVSGTESRADRQSDAAERDETQPVQTRRTHNDAHTRNQRT
jgi:hypothetical protein